MSAQHALLSEPAPIDLDWELVNDIPASCDNLLKTSSASTGAPDPAIGINDQDASNDDKAGKDINETTKDKNTTPNTTVDESAVAPIHEAEWRLYFEPGYLSYPIVPAHRVWYMKTEDQPRLLTIAEVKEVGRAVVERAQRKHLMARKGSGAKKQYLREWQYLRERFWECGHENGAMYDLD